MVDEQADIHFLTQWNGRLMEYSETLFIIFVLLCDRFSKAAIYFSRKSVVLTVSL